MTVVIALKVGDGLVLSADSASTMSDRHGNYMNTYFNAEKLFHLSCGIPVGLLTFGLGGIQGRSISAHVKDLRARIRTQGDSFYVNPSTSTIGEVARRVREYFYEGLYKKHISTDNQSPAMGFIVAGYSPGASSGEIWEVLIGEGGQCLEPQCHVPEGQESGIWWRGVTEACCRFVNGWSPELAGRLIAAGMPEKEARALLQTSTILYYPGMPIKDAIDLADYLTYMSCQFVRFAPGTQIASEPIDTAAITKYEGFRWVRRKFYYPREANLPRVVSD